jgi:hypothetical protein
MDFDYHTKRAYTFFPTYSSLKSCFFLYRVHDVSLTLLLYKVYYYYINIYISTAITLIYKINNYMSNIDWQLTRTQYVFLPYVENEIFWLIKNSAKSKITKKPYKYSSSPVVLLYFSIVSVSLTLWYLGVSACPPRHWSQRSVGKNPKSAEDQKIRKKKIRIIKIKQNNNKSKKTVIGTELGCEGNLRWAKYDEPWQVFAVVRTNSATRVESESGIGKPRLNNKKPFNP